LKLVIHLYVCNHMGLPVAVDERIVMDIQWRRKQIANLCAGYVVPHEVSLAAVKFLKSTHLYIVKK